MVSDRLFKHQRPPAVAFFWLSACTFLALPAVTVANVLLPQATNKIVARESNILSWPILPTPAPASLLGLTRRQPNTICGYIGGDPELPATCLAGSHCAVDVEHGAIGCCPDDGDCSQGIFTGCIDRNSGPQTVADPYVYTCRGQDVCYRNTFEGGFFQYGCGTASELATKVAQSAPGKGPIQLTTISVELTATPTSLSQPTTPTKDRTSSTGADSSSSVASSSCLWSPSPTKVAGDAPSSSGSTTKHAGAIIGGAVGGVAVIFALAALGFFLWRRQRANIRHGPGEDDSPTYMKSVPPNGHQFEPLEPSRLETSQVRLADDVIPVTRDEDIPDTENVLLVRPPHQLYADETVETAALRGGERNVDSDRIPLTRELDDFSQGFNTALESIDIEGEAEPNHNMATYPGPRRSRGGNGVLWQQNRRRSRNLA